MKRLFLALAFFTASLLGNAQSFDSSQKALFVEDIHVSGTRSLDTAELNEIVGPLSQLKVRGGSEEIRERIRFQFQEHGYYDADIKSLKVKAIDPLAIPEPVVVEAEVDEGVPYRFGEVQFTGDHVMSADELRAAFPIRAGESFSRSKVAAGLEALRTAYEKVGYIDFTTVPDAQKAGTGEIKLVIDVDEGRQFRMGSLQLVGDPDIADRLRARWKLEAGQPFDVSYYRQFLKENGKLLGDDRTDVGYSSGLARNCRENVITVFIEYGNHLNAVPPRDVDCDQNSDTTSQPTSR